MQRVTQAKRGFARTKTVTFFLLVILAVLGSNLHSKAQNEQEVLTNSDVVKMVQAHLGVDIILEQIKSRPGNYSLSTDSLIKLKQLGVPDKVISAMQAKKRTPIVTSPPATGREYGSTVPSAVSAPPTVSPQVSSQQSNLPEPPSPAARGTHSSAFDPPMLDTNAYSRLGDDSVYLFDFNFMRLEPRALEDDAILQDFVYLNNCDNPAIYKRLASEFDYPEIAAFYKTKAAQILAAAPSTFKWTAPVTLGIYDPTRRVFPIERTHNGNNPLGDWMLSRGEFSPGYSGSCRGAGFKFTEGSSLFPGGRNLAHFQLVFKPFNVSEVPMNEEDARRFIEQSTGRNVVLVGRVKILEQRPKIFVSPRGQVTIEFAGKVEEVKVIDRLPDAFGRGGQTLSILLDPGSDSKVPTHVSDAGSGAAAPLSSTEASSTEQQAEMFYYKKRYEEALPLFTRACDSGSQDGCGAEGFLYAFGLGVTADLARGKDLMTSSCESGSSKGCDALGLAYLRGVGVSQDTNKALDLFNRSCTGGFAPGCVNLSECYRRGIGQPQDKEKGLKIFDQACSTGHDQFATACEGGDTEGCRELASCYLRGIIGGKKDLVKAKELFTQACGMGDKSACQSASNLH